MTVSHPASVRSRMADLVVDLLDAGSGPGRLVFSSASDVMVATLQFSRPAFASALDGVAGANVILEDASAIGGTIAKARAYDSNGTEVFACSVTATGGGGDIELNSVQIAPTQEVSMTSLIYRAPGS